ncbi:MAG: hypothetical protein KGL35_07995 [Bradyrhizobium sp.]|nr:hypothetical protein [Bradyrhizobium sp.]
MIKFLGEKEGRPCLGFGLSRANCEKLLEGKPIFIDLKVMLMKMDQPPDLNEATVLLFGGETEGSMSAQLGKKPPQTFTHNEEN